MAKERNWAVEWHLADSEEHEVTTTDVIAENPYHALRRALNSIEIDKVDQVLIRLCPAIDG